MPGAMLAMELNFMGPNYPANTACATGNYCIKVTDRLPAAPDDGWVLRRTFCSGRARPRPQPQSLRHTAHHPRLASRGPQLAMDHIRRGDADVMLAGGAEASVLPLGIQGFIACKALSQRNDDPAAASRPWDKGRDGFVMGEGAGVLVLESLEHAQVKGAPPCAMHAEGSADGRLTRRCAVLCRRLGTG